MKPRQHKAKLAFLSGDVHREIFLQLEDGRMLIVEISEGQLAGFVADGAKQMASRYSGVNA